MYNLFKKEDIANGIIIPGNNIIDVFKKKNFPETEHRFSDNKDPYESAAKDIAKYIIYLLTTNDKEKWISQKEESILDMLKEEKEKYGDILISAKEENGILYICRKGIVYLKYLNEPLDVGTPALAYGGATYGGPIGAALGWIISRIFNIHGKKEADHSRLNNYDYLMKTSQNVPPSFLAKCFNY